MNAVVDYRVSQLTQAYETFLSSFAQIAKEKQGFQIMVTAMDGYGSPELREYLGVDMKSNYRTAKKISVRPASGRPGNSLVDRPGAVCRNW